MSKHADNVDKENRMVPCTHTIIDPHAVMIKPFNTPIADVAVSAFICANNTTGRAKSIRVKSFHKS